MPGIDAALVALAAAQAIALLVLTFRLLPGRRRRPPVAPMVRPSTDTTVSVIVPSRNEASRIGPCLAALRAQTSPLLETIVVDAGSTDGTREIVAAAAALDPRIRLEPEPPRPPGWVGKVWALEHALHIARGEWMLGVDADTEPEPGMVAAVVNAARSNGYSVVSFSPRFAGMTAAEQLVQPALLLSLIYRTGAAGADAPPHRVLANGQCFLARRDVLTAHGGYAVARDSFADDVTLARHLAHAGCRVGFLDGSRLYRVRAYTSLAEMWREWGRSIDLKNANSSARQWVDVAFLVAVQGLPLIVLATLGTRAASGAPLSREALALGLVNAILLAIRLALLLPMASAYDRPGIAFWMSWLADSAAAVRIILSTIRRRPTWRGQAFVADEHAPS